jgi:hypothetical protein
MTDPRLKSKIYGYLRHLESFRSIGLACGLLKPLKVCSIHWHFVPLRFILQSDFLKKRSKSTGIFVFKVNMAYWLIEELTQHMDKKVLPSNGDILRHFDNKKTS